MNRLNIINILVLSVLLFSCEKQENGQMSDYTYFPLELGQYQVYEVSETRYNIPNIEIQAKYYIKEEVNEVYENPTKDKVYKIQRFKKQDLAHPWKIDSVWSSQLFANRAIRTENNITQVKLVFPIQSGQYWNRNEYNNLNVEKNIYQNIGESFAVNGNYFNNTVSVYLKNDSSLITKNVHFEVYAPTYGMIYSEKMVLAYCQSSPTCIGKNQIDFGVVRKIKLLEKGISK
ncbi:hypothetical protein [Lacihabitans soyangensis]|nr:hypothetical protein [Lacihabitans soyangensis]